VEGFAGYKDGYTIVRDALSGIRSVSMSRLKGDKLTKIGTAEPIFEAGNVHLLRAPWNQLWLKQHAAFTGLGDSHDDAVDTTAIITEHFTGQAAGPGMLLRR
jgi:predicted phage terminase large subunit-like protein